MPRRTDDDPGCSLLEQRHRLVCQHAPGDRDWSKWRFVRDVGTRQHDLIDLGRKLRRPRGKPLVSHGDVYNRLRQGRDDEKAVVAVGFGTDKELNPTDLVQIYDDLKVFPTYYAGPLVNRLLLRKFPKVEAALLRLKGTY